MMKLFFIKKQSIIYSWTVFFVLSWTWVFVSLPSDNLLSLVIAAGLLILFIGIMLRVLWKKHRSACIKFLRYLFSGAVFTGIFFVIGMILSVMIFSLFSNNREKQIFMFFWTNAIFILGTLMVKSKTLIERLLVRDQE